MQKTIEFGAIVSDFRFPRIPKSSGEGIQFWSELAGNLEGIGIELQPELYYLTDLPEGLIFHSRHPFIGVHQPCHGRDVLSPDIHKASASRHDTETAMAIANNIGAEYFVIHPVQIDNWVQRVEQRQVATQYVKEVIEHKKQKGYSFKLCVENLEYPKYPSTLEEMITLLSDINTSESPEITLLFDVAHHWHNVVHLFHQIPGFELVTDEHYYDVLLNDLTVLTHRFGPEIIEGFHIAQAYIEGQIHNTHGLPGLLDNEVFSPEHLYSFARPSHMQEKWLDVERVLQCIGVWMKGEEVPMTRAVIESHHRSESEMGQMAILLQQTI